jgi:hypothetical protein
LTIDLTSALRSLGSDSEVERASRRSFRSPSSPLFFPPPFAAVHPDERSWALAWVGENGLWFARNDPPSPDPDTLRSPFTGTLFTDEADSRKVQFSNDAEQLVLFEQTRGPVRGAVRVYDVRPQWIRRVLGEGDALSESEIVKLACNIERRDMADEGGDAESTTEPTPGKSPDGAQKFETISMPCGLDKHN